MELGVTELVFFFSSVLGLVQDNKHRFVPLSGTAESATPILP